MSARHSSPVMLYVEDEEADVFFMRRAFQYCRMLWQVHTVADGREALSYLRGLGQYSDRKQFPEPDIVLLDVRLPLMSGFEVLAAIRLQPEYINLPVIMFSSSSKRDDRRRANQLGANGYITKPFSIEDCAQTAMEIQAFYERCDRVATAEARRGSIIRI